MYQMMIVEDEDIEREGMVNFIDWEGVDIEIVAQAWNGLEGYNRIVQQRPDIVITDIKMPLMDGIEMIRKVKEVLPDTVFVVLSGYGDFEYTSQAMELGVRYYVLKPCDEDKIMVVIHKAIEELKYRRKIGMSEMLLPTAKEEFFRKSLLNGNVPKAEIQRFMKHEELQYGDLVLMVFHFEKELEELTRFVMMNILDELLAPRFLILSTYSDTEIIYLVKVDQMQTLEQLVIKLRHQYMHFHFPEFLVIVRKVHNFMNLHENYRDIEALMVLTKGDMGYQFVRYDALDKIEKGHRLLPYVHDLMERDTVEACLEGLTFIVVLMKAYSLDEKTQMGLWRYVLYQMSQHKMGFEDIQLKAGTLEEQFIEVVALLAEHRMNSLNWTPILEEKPYIPMYIMAYVSDENFNVNVLANEILYMNPDYISRLFKRRYGIRFTDYVIERKIAIAKRLIEELEDWTISEVGALLGFKSDGQYFSKVFRKVTKMTPGDYRKKHLSK